MKNKKIIFIANTSWYLWNFRKNLMRALQKEGFELYALAPRDQYSDLLAKEFTFIELHKLDRGGMNPFRDIAFCFELRRIYKKIQPGIVLHFTIKPNIYSSFVCRFLHINYINAITGLGSSFLESGILKRITLFLYKIALAKSDKVVFQNEEDRDIFIQQKITAPDRTCIIRGSGVDTVFSARSLLLQQYRIRSFF